MGAALTTIVSQLLLLFLQAGLIGAELRNKAGLARSLPGPLVCGLIAWISLRLMDSHGINLFVNLLASGLVFALCALATRTITRQDLLTVKAFLIDRKKKDHPEVENDLDDYREPSPFQRSPAQ